MEPIYHLVEPAAWEANPAADYAVASLDSEGFIHCAFAPQVALAANRFYPDASALLAVRLDPARLTSPLRIEPPSPISTSGQMLDRKSTRLNSSHHRLSRMPSSA